MEPTRPSGHATIPGWGADRRPAARPGVPMERPPRPAEGVHWERPEQQPPHGGVAVRPGLRGPTPVFGTAQPFHGASGVLRRLAYRVPDHRARHWFLLMFADRVNVLENAAARGIRWLLPATGVAGAVFFLRSLRQH